MKSNNKIVLFLIFLLLLVFMASCAVSKNPYQKRKKRKGEPCDCPDTKHNKRMRTGYWFLVPASEKENKNSIVV